MNYTVRALTVRDELIMWEMLRHASHEPSLESVRKQPYLARYVSGWGRVGDVGCVAIRATASIGAAAFMDGARQGIDFQAILAEPLQIIVEALQAQSTWDNLLHNLPDISLESAKSHGLV